MAAASKSHRTATSTNHVPHLVASSRNFMCPIYASPDRIRELAYEVYARRCELGGPGDALSDWMQAEGELRCQARPRWDMQ
jgi:hypothetical protein